MPIHDWTRVDAGTFHDFHGAWITHLKEALKPRLPKDFYAMAEQHAGKPASADVLALHRSEPTILAPVPEPTDGRAIALAESPPKVSRTDTLLPSRHPQPRTLTIRHKSGHRIVALVEVVSPANKATKEKLKSFLRKVRSALRARVHVAVLDLFPPGRHDPDGIHGAIHAAVDDEPYELPPGKPLTFASYAAGQETVAYLEHFSPGDAVKELPLFLTAKSYVQLPLPTSYAMAYDGMAGFVQEALEGGPG